MQNRVVARLDTPDVAPAQQNELRVVEIQRRRRPVDPDMGSTVSRTGDRRIDRHRVINLRRLSPIRNEASLVVSQPQIHAEPAPVLRRGTEGLALLLDGRRPRFDQPPDPPDTAGVLTGPICVVLRDGRPLDSIGIEQRRACMTLCRRGELPRQVVGVLDRRVHAESARRRELVSRVADQEYLPVGEPLSHRRGHHPRDDIGDPKVKVLGKLRPDRPADPLRCRADVEVFRPVHRRVVVELAQPPVVDIDLLEHVACRTGRPVQGSGAMIGPRSEVGVELAVDHRPEAGDAGYLDVEAASHSRRGPVGADQPASGQMPGARWAAHLDSRLLAVVSDIDEFSVPIDLHFAHGTEVAEQDLLDPILRCQQPRRRRKLLTVYDRLDVGRHPADLVARQGLAVHELLGPRQRQAHLHHLVEHAPLAHQLGGAHVDRPGPRMGVHAAATLHDDGLQAHASEQDRHRQSRRSRTRDENSGVSHERSAARA